MTVHSYAQFIQFACGGDCLDERMPINIKDGTVTVIESLANTPITFVSRSDASAFCAWRGSGCPPKPSLKELLVAMMMRIGLGRLMPDLGVRTQTLVLRGDAALTTCIKAASVKSMSPAKGSLISEVMLRNGLRMSFQLILEA